MVFDSAVDVVVPGPTLGLNPPREAALPPLPAHPAVAAAFLNEGKRKEREEGRDRNGFCLGTNFSIDDCSESSSSIGDGSLSAAEDGDGDGDGDGEGEVQSRLKEGPLGCLDSLEDSLPIKKGLSNCFSGKSKSFASLSDAATAQDLAKPENPFNKRRRILMACKVSLSRRTTSYCSLNMSTFRRSDLPLVEEDEEERRDCTSPLPSLHQHRQQFKTFRSNARSFSLSDLQHA